MPRFSANLSILFGDLPFLDRFQAAREAGFSAVECWFPHEHGVNDIAQRLGDLDLKMVGINSAHGDAADWGLAALPGRESEFKTSIEQALQSATRFDNCAVHVMAGLAGSVRREDAWQTYLKNLECAVRIAEGSGVQLLIEPLNSRDRPGYLLHSVEQAAQIIERTGLSSLRIMFDCYHVQVEEGDLISRMRRHWSKIGHLQIACPPSRSEPGTGELDYDFIFAEIDSLGWSGWVGAEYIPSGKTIDSLSWFHKHAAVLRG